MAQSLYAADVLNEQGTLIEGARDKNPELFELIIKHVDDIGVSAITCSFDTFAEKVGGITGDVKGSHRKFLIISGGQPFKILVDVRNFGKYLVVNQIKWLEGHGKRLQKTGEDFHLSFTYFKGENASLFVSVVRMAVNDAVKDLIAGLGDQGQDPKEVLKGW